MGNKKNGIIGWLAVAILIVAAVALAGHDLSFAPSVMPSPSSMPPSIAPPSYNYALIPHATSQTLGSIFAFSGGVNTTVNANIIYLGNTITTTLQLDIPSNLRTTTWTPGVTKMVATSCGSYVWSNTTNTYVKESGIYNGSGSVIGSNLSYTPTSIGIYIFGLACVTSNTTFSNGAWTAWSTPNITLSTYQVYKIPQLYNLVVTNNGCSSVSGAGTYFAGNTTTISATVPSGYSFSWTGSGNGSYNGNSNPATLTMNGNIQETALCSVPPPPPPPQSNVFSQITTFLSGIWQGILQALGL